LAISIRMFIFMTGVFLFVVILDLIRRRKFREDLSLVWIVIGIGLILSSFADRIIDPLAFSLGVSYPPVLVFLMIFFLLVIAMLYFSTIVSDLKSRNKELCQKVALMEYKLSRVYQEKSYNRK
jgi:hypothetical protein